MNQIEVPEPPNDGPLPTTDMSLFEFMHQGEYWIDINRQQMLIKDMKRSHAYNCRKFLRKRALGIQLAIINQLYDFQLILRGQQAIWSVDDEISRIEMEDPLEWLENTEIYQALNKQAGDYKPQPALVVAGSNRRRIRLPSG